MSKKTASGHGSGMSIHGTTLPPSGKDGENQGGLQSWRSAGVLANILWSVGQSVGRPSVRRSAGLPASLSVSLSLSRACVQERGRTTEKEGEGESVRERETGRGRTKRGRAVGKENSSLGGEAKAMVRFFRKWRHPYPLWSSTLKGPLKCVCTSLAAI